MVCDRWFLAVNDRPTDKSPAVAEKNGSNAQFVTQIFALTQLWKSHGPNKLPEISLLTKHFLLWFNWVSNFC